MDSLSISYSGSSWISEGAREGAIHHDQSVSLSISKSCHVIYKPRTTVALNRVCFQVSFLLLLLIFNWGKFFTNSCYIFKYIFLRQIYLYFAEKPKCVLNYVFWEQNKPCCLLSEHAELSICRWKWNMCTTTRGHPFSHFIFYSLHNDVNLMNGNGHSDAVHP